YYVQGKDATQNVQYFADDWGYHPVVEYSSVGPHSRVSSHFALGEEAVKQLKNKENNLPQLQGILENGNRLDQPSAVLQSPVQEQQNKLEHQQVLSQKRPQEKANVSPVLPPSGTSLFPGVNPGGEQPSQIFENKGQLKPDLPQRLELLLQEQQRQTQPDEQLHNQFPEIQEQSGQHPLETLQQDQERKVDDFQHNKQQIVDIIFQQQGLPQQLVHLQTDLSQQSQEDVNEKQTQDEQLQQEQLRQQNYIQPRFREQVSVQELHLQPQQVFLKHEEPSQRVIFPQEGPNIQENNSQDIYLNQNPTNNDIPNREQSREQESVDENRFETAALFENSNSKLVVNQQLDHTNEDGAYVESSLATQNFNNFGAKLATEKNTEDTTNKLIEHTKNLITGQDVININEAIIKDDSGVDSSTYESLSTTYSQNSPQIQSEIAPQHVDYAVSYSTTTSSPVSQPTLGEQPIVVEEYDENTVQSTTERFEIKESTQEQHYTVASEEKVASRVTDVTEPSTILVTPRPVSTRFLAPITAGIQLQNIELQTDERKSSGDQNYQVDIQKSVPYYLGKFEYPSVYEQEQQVTFNQTSEEKSSAEIKATEDIELGKTLLFFPGQSSSKVEIQKLPHVEVRRPFAEVSNYITLQKIPSTSIKDQIAAIDQQQAQGYHHQVTLQHVDQQQAQGYQHQVASQYVDGGASAHIALKPTEITKVIHKPYPVKVPVEVPYPVIKQVQVPVTVQKIVEKPIHITKYVEKPVAIPQPYPVEKIVERPVHVPVHVTKYIDRPYPVEVRVPYPQPYPVEKVVQKIVKQPYPVEVRVPVHIEKIVERKVPVPHYIEKPVEKIVEKPITHYVDRPVPVEVKVPVLQPYLVRVELPKPYPSEVNKGSYKPYGLVQIPEVQVHSYLLPQKVVSSLQPGKLQAANINLQSGNGHTTKLQTVQVPAQSSTYSQTSYNNQQEQHAQGSQHTQTYFYANPYAYAPQINHYLPPKQDIIVNNGYLPSKQQYSAYLPPKTECNLKAAETSSKSLYYTIRPEDYIGLLPPKLGNNQGNFVNKLRTARSNFDDKSVRMEYGFLPPLIPSLEIDEQGNPIDKGEK
ncbi:hypothetical protein NQ318_019343, partial [Aromia moschata]